MPTLIDDPYYQIAKGNFEAEGIVRERGEIVDTTNWRTTRGLAERRVIVPIPCAIEEAITCDCGRRWVDRISSVRHDCPARAEKHAATKSAVPVAA